jgi:uncharacterized protein YgiM (DUF1202 family)
LLSGAFYAGRYVQADTAVQGDPGSSQDPLVTQSYVDAQVKALQAQVAALQSRVAALEAKSGSIGTTAPVSQTPSTGTTTTPVNPAPTTGAVKQVYPAGSTRVNVRSGPGTTYTVVGKIEVNNSAELISEKNGWYYIKMSNSKNGWVSKSVVKLK